MHKLLSSALVKNVGIKWNDDDEPGPTSVSDPTNAILTDSAQISSDTFQNPVESLFRTVMARTDDRKF